MLKNLIPAVISAFISLGIGMALAAWVAPLNPVQCQVPGVCNDINAALSAINSNFSTAVTCSPGSPSASFSVLNGVVTHC